MSDTQSDAAFSSSQPLNNSRHDLTDRFLALWKIGHDTASIAQVCRVDEHVVYNALSRGRRRNRPATFLIPYAGAEY